MLNGYLCHHLQVEITGLIAGLVTAMRILISNQKEIAGLVAGLTAALKLLNFINTTSYLRYHLQVEITELIADLVTAMRILTPN